MAPDANPPRPSSALAADEARFVEISNALADAVERAVPPWIERLVIDRVRMWSGHVGPEVAAAAVAAGESARDALMPPLRSLLATDVDEQRSNPLSLLRDATRHADEVLADAGVPSIARDDFAVRSFPDDSYGLAPATWNDVDPSLHEIGITWGAAKAYIHKARRRAEGRS